MWYPDVNQILFKKWIRYYNNMYVFGLFLHIRNPHIFNYNKNKKILKQILMTFLRIIFIKKKN